jgi:hypothetical protein
VELSAIMVVFYMQISEYGFRFDVVVKREWMFTHEVTSSC